MTPLDVAVAIDLLEFRSSAPYEFISWLSGGSTGWEDYLDASQGRGSVEDEWLLDRIEHDGDGGTHPA